MITIKAPCRDTATKFPRGRFKDKMLKKVLGILAEQLEWASEGIMPKTFGTSHFVRFAFCRYIYKESHGMIWNAKKKTELSPPRFGLRWGKKEERIKAMPVKSQTNGGGGCHVCTGWVLGPGSTLLDDLSPALQRGSATLPWQLTPQVLLPLSVIFFLAPRLCVKKLNFSRII